MIENMKLKKKLLIITIILVVIESVIFYYKNVFFIIDFLSNIMLGVIASFIVAYIVAIITYNYQKEESKEKMIKELLEIYVKMVLLKATYNGSNNKNQLIVKFQKDINDFLEIIYDIEYDLVYKIKEVKLKDTIVLKKHNDYAIKNISEGFEVGNNYYCNNAKGLKNQKEFIESFNKLLKKVREYLEKYCVHKYNMKYNFYKELDYKYGELESKSNKKIKYQLN